MSSQDIQRQHVSLHNKRKVEFWLGQVWDGFIFTEGEEKHRFFCCHGKG